MKSVLTPQYIPSGKTKLELLRPAVSRALVVSLPVEAKLGEEVADNEPIFSKCERKPQSQLVKASFLIWKPVENNLEIICQDVIAYSTGSLSRITFHYPPTFSSHDIVLIISRYEDTLVTNEIIGKFD